MAGEQDNGRARQTARLTDVHRVVIPITAGHVLVDIVVDARHGCGVDGDETRVLEAKRGSEAGAAQKSGGTRARAGGREVATTGMEERRRGWPRGRRGPQTQGLARGCRAGARTGERGRGWCDEATTRVVMAVGRRAEGGGRRGTRAGGGSNVVVVRDRGPSGTQSG